MKDQLIARFVFNEGDPIDVRFARDKKDDFIKALEKKIIYIDSTSDTAFWPNLSQLKCFFIMVPPQTPEDDDDAA